MGEFPQIEGYRVVSELGAGSVSIVYKAVQEPLGRTVALKVLRATVSPTSSFALALEREAKLLAQLSHPGIALLYDFVKTASRIHLVLEFVDGVSLSAILEKRAAFPPDVVAAIGIEVARALSYAHARGIVHRDIKPSSILVSRLGEVKIIDFALAQSGSEAETSASGRSHGESASFSAPSYMPPERLLGERIEPRSDLFSVAVILYELLAGMRPFERGGDPQRRSSNIRLRREAAIPLHRRAPHVPRALERVIMQALDKNPQNRQESAAVFADALEQSVTFASEPRAQTAMRILELAGFAAPPATKGEAAEGAAPAGRRPGHTLVGFVATLLVLVTFGSIIQATAPRRLRPFEGAPLALSPPHKGALRVLASPWAEVSVDGQMIDSTPMAHAIPLPPGTHYVTLKHPNAPEEQRTVAIKEGEQQTLDVVMSIESNSADPKGDAGSGRRDAQ